MKSIQGLLMGLSSMAMFFSCQEKPQGYLIDGTVKGMEQGMVYLYEYKELGRNLTHVIDSTQLNNGKFVFEGKVDHTDMVRIAIDNKYIGEFFIENNQIAVEIDLTNSNPKGGMFQPQVVGSSAQDLLAQVTQKVEDVRKAEKYLPLKHAEKLYQKAVASKKQEDLDSMYAYQNSLKDLYADQFNEQRQVKFDFVEANPSSPVSIYVLGGSFTEPFLSEKQLKHYYNLFTGEAKETTYYKGYMTKAIESFATMGVGCRVPDFKLKNLAGEEVLLSDIKAKYILVDFWASWCGPCRGSFAHLKELYAEYHKDGFEILGVNTGDQEAGWRKAVKEDETPWMHVFDDKSMTERDKCVASAFDVKFLPTTFLIDSEQKIVLRIPKPEDLDKKLREVFKN